MIRRGGSDWTAVAVDEVLAIFFTKRGRAAQLFENAQCSVNSLPAGFALQVRQMFPGFGSPRGAHSRAEKFRVYPARGYWDQRREQMALCLLIQMFSFGARRVTRRRVW